MHIPQPLVFAAALTLAQGHRFASHDSLDYTFKGVFEHDGVKFELHSSNASASPAASYQQYIANTAVLEPRGYDPHKSKKYQWLNCTAEGTFVGGCNNDRKTAPKEFLRLNGYHDTKVQLSEMMTEAFKDGRGYKAPRSICRTTQDSSLCVSWDQVVNETLRPDQQAAMVDFAMSCNSPTGFLSSQMRTGFDNNITDTKGPDFHMVCVSGRAKDCTRAEWFCSDLWSWDPTEYRGRRFESAIPSWWNNHGWSWPWAKGPCTRNCDPK